MSELREIDVVVLDCQATGATPEQGDLLELGWTRARASEGDRPVHAHWIVPRSGRAVPRIVRELTGFRDDCLATALAPEACWSLLRDDVMRGEGPAKAVIHFARFELAFLRDLHARTDDASSAFPLDAVCLHAIAQRLFPELPRKSLRALAGMHGFPAELLRRSEGHVKATAFLWRALVPKLEERGVSTWSGLHAWLADPAPKRSKRVYPMPVEKRRRLPDGPGVYRFLRSNGDVLYVGKAASVKKRVASHFTAPARATERALEMLTQASDIVVTTTASALEAAILEVDEIKRFDPPYNVQLRDGDGRVWFAPGPNGPIGPLPSRHAVTALGAIHALACGGEATDERMALATGVPRAFAPDGRSFVEGFASFVEAHLARRTERTMLALLRASRSVQLDDDDRAEEGAPPSGWDPARVRRRLDRSLATAGRLVRRARWLCILSDSVVTFREADDIRRRVLIVRDAEIAVAESEPEDAPALRPWRVRQMGFDRARYDRLRVLTTELARVHGEGGDVAVRVGDRRIERGRIAKVFRWL